ncbi:MAG: Ig-like domain-containing protein [Cyclobacteriaceae bacterium]|nr:Ig-like domain-containing protein [Cyclobacteriaceae bacterium]
MKKAKYLILMALLAVPAGMFLESCSSDDTPGALTIVSLMTDGGIALDEATAATGVPLSASVVATFNKAVNASTATAANITLQINGVDVPATITASGAVITIDPTEDMATGTNHTVKISAGLKASDGGSASAETFTFKSFGPPAVTAPQPDHLLSFFSFNGDVSDAKGALHTPAAADVKDITFVEDRFGFAGLAANFNGTTSIVEIPEGDDYMVGPDFSISFWIKANSTKEGHFVLGLAAWYGFQFEIMGGPWDADDKGVKLATRYDVTGGLTEAEDTWWNAEPNGWQGSTFAKDVPAPNGIDLYFKDKWVHVVCTYQASTKIGRMYVNGEKTREWDFDLWSNPCTPPGKCAATGVKYAGNTTGGGNKLALGFIQASGNRIVTDSWADPSDPLNNHFKGLMDDLRIWKVALTEAEIVALHTAEKP